MSLGAFINGAFDGYAWREGMEQRKTDRERDDVLWDWQKEDREHTMNERERATQRRDRADASRARANEIEGGLDNIEASAWDEWKDGAPPPAAAPQAPARAPLQPAASAGAVAAPRVRSPLLLEQPAMALPTAARASQAPALAGGTRPDDPLGLRQ